MKYLDKTIEYGLYLLVFLLPVQTRWIIKAGELHGGYWEYGTYSLYATDILLFIVLSLFIIGQITRSFCHLAEFLAIEAERLPRQQHLPPFNKQLHNSRIVWGFIGGLLLMSSISVFFAASNLLALYKFGWLILGLGLFWLVTSANYDRLKLIYALSAGALLSAGLAIWQFLTQSSFESKWLGLALHKASDLGSSVIEVVGPDGIGERWLRAYGGLDHPNILGGVMAVGILLILNLCLAGAPSEKSPARLASLKLQRSERATPLLKGLVVVFSAALFFSFSRSAWLGLAAALALMTAQAVAGRNLKAQKSLAEIILIMGFLFFILFSQYENLLAARVSGQGRLEGKSVAERIISYQDSWQLIKKNRLFGVGLGNYTLALNRVRPGEKSYFFQPVHNVFILAWSEIGIIGFLFFIALLFAIARSLFRHPPTGGGGRVTRQSDYLSSRRAERGEIYNSWLARLPSIIDFSPAARNDGKGEVAHNDSAILITLVVIMCLDHWLWSLHFGVLFFWLMMGLMAGKKINPLNPRGYGRDKPPFKGEQ